MIPPHPPINLPLLYPYHIQINLGRSDRLMPHPCLNLVDRDTLLYGVDTESVAKPLGTGLYAIDSCRYHDSLDVPIRRASTETPQLHATNILIIIPQRQEEARQQRNTPVHLRSPLFECQDKDHLLIKINIILLDRQHLRNPRTRVVQHE